MTMADLSRATELAMIHGRRGRAGRGSAGRRTAALRRSSQAPVDLQQAAAEIRHYSFNDNPEGGELGSNGWAFGRNATPDGRGLLLGNPHFPWTGTEPISGKCTRPFPAGSTSWA